MACTMQSRYLRCPRTSAGVARTIGRNLKGRPEMQTLPGFTAEAATSHRGGFYATYPLQGNRPSAYSVAMAAQCCLPGQDATKCFCPPGRTNCGAGATCVNLSSDSNNCGACNNKCPAGQSCCGAICVDLSRDPSNCGACGNTCTTGYCCAGTCGVRCGGGCCPAGQPCCGGRSCCPENYFCCSDGNGCCPNGWHCRYNYCTLF